MNINYKSQFKLSGLALLLGVSLIWSCKKETNEPEKEAPIRPITTSSNMYVTDLFEFLPAPGQYINKAPGNMESARGILGKRGMVSLGSWGGFIVLGFDHTVINQADKEDIIIYNNAMSNFAEPGIVWVMQDENGNGQPDDTWYEVAGSEFKSTGYVRNYEVTYTKPDSVSRPIPWKDNKGNTGVVQTNTYHRQSYFPEWVTGNEYTLKGSLLTSLNIDMSNPSLITSKPFAWGYADNTNGGDRIDIANAVDKDGKKKTLKGIDFIKVQTAVQANMGWLGELSTEVIGVADLSLVK
ncbi:MAG: cell surface protein [Pedobacter sp.]|nr:MAG: cell surface protein [Pedobacter sp.]